MFQFKKSLPTALAMISTLMAPQVGSAHAPVVILPVHHAVKLLPLSVSTRFSQPTAVQLKLQTLLASRLSAGAFRTQQLIKTTTANGISTGSTNTLLGNLRSGQILDRFYEGGSTTGPQGLYGQELDTFGSNPFNTGTTGLVTILNTSDGFNFTQSTKTVTGGLLPLLKSSKAALPFHLSGAQRALNQQYGTITGNAVNLGNKIGNNVQGGLFSGYFYGASGPVPGNFTQDGTYVISFGNNIYNKAGIASIPFIKNNYIEYGGKIIPISSGQLLSTYYQVSSGAVYRGEGYNVYGVAGSLLNTPGHAPIYVSPKTFLSFLLR